jgi:hypothetical protein
VLLLLASAGLLNGYAWIGGANSAAFVPVGEGWGTGVGASGDTLLFLAVVFAMVTLGGHLAYASTVFGTLVRGRAVSQEVLISVSDE